MFVDVANGSELLLLAVRRDVADLSVAHRIVDMLARTGRVPKTPAAFKYMRAMSYRAPEEAARILRACANVESDPDRTPAAQAYKHEAGQQRKAIERRRALAAAAAPEAAPPAAPQGS